MGISRCDDSTTTGQATAVTKHYTGIGGNENSFMTYEECEDACRGLQSRKESVLESNFEVPDQARWRISHATNIDYLNSQASFELMYKTRNANEVEQSSTKLPSSREVTEAEIPSSTTPKAPPEITVEPSTISPFGDFKEPLSSKSAESSHETVKVRILWQDKNPCELPSSAGTPGGVARKMWHFNESLMSCVPFVFLGSGGNANRFKDPESCMRTCGSEKNKKQSTAAVVTSTMGTRPVTRIFQEFHSSEATTTVPTTTAAPSSTPIRPSSEKSAELVYVTSTPSHTSPEPSPSTEGAYTSSTEEATDDPFPTLISIPKEFVPPFPQVTLLPAVSPKGGKFPKTTPEPPHTEEYQFIFEHLLQSTEEPHKPTKVPHVAIPDYLAQLESAEKYAELIASPKWSSQESVEAALPASSQAPAVGQPALLVGSMHVITPGTVKQVQQPKPFVQPEPERAKEIQQAKPFVQPEPERAKQIQQPVPFVQPQPALPYVGAPVQNYQSSVPPMFYISNPGIHPAPGSPTAYNYVKSSAMPVNGITPLYGRYLSTHQKPGVTLNPQWIERGAQAFYQVVEQRVVPTAASLQPSAATVAPAAILIPPKPEDLSASLQKLLQYHTRDKSHSSVNPDLVQPEPSGAQPITKQELTTLNQSSTAVDVSPCHSPLYGDVVIMCVLEDVICPAGTFCQLLPVFAAIVSKWDFLQTSRRPRVLLSGANEVNKASGFRFCTARHTTPSMRSACFKWIWEPIHFEEYGQCLHFIYSALPTVVEFSIPVVTHPVCPHGEVATNEQTPVKCDALMGYGCPSGYVCTPTGGDAYCCQAPESFCLQPRPPLSVCLSPDSPPVQRIEFTYDPLADRCIRFSYSSCSPTYNLNHFETDSQCQRLCCNQGYDLVYKRRLMKLNDSPLDISENSDRR
ncbi:Kunitz/Bovine pancreatic trypsin inhibitor domain protein [Teladorsagia circumcincta]|uniref:Kunitz/Bovine pancreatic trypsin inhibitor domain protein n=1 Tax=Teladorsagia circumcincta TaxID=45464 RepID=A0A2G9V6B2_TELCI|nr:Kunitz/Bovine pancreatic trypsin inhibitor domain protein [Teladorsagia circumcincta]